MRLRSRERLTLFNPPLDLKLPDGVRLDSKDRADPARAAIHRKANFLLAGDGRHFGHLHGKHIERVMVLRPAQYFERPARRSPSPF